MRRAKKYSSTMATAVKLYNHVPLGRC